MTEPSLKLALLPLNRPFDTMIASYLLDPGRRQHGLASLALEHLDEAMTPIENLIGKGQTQLSFADVGVSEASDYACADADVTLRLTGLLRDRVREEGLEPLLTEVEMPLVRVLAAMETQLAGEMRRQEAQIHRLAGEPFNINSPKQLQTVLFEKLGLKPRRRTKTGYSTSQAVLQEIIRAHIRSHPDWPGFAIKIIADTRR